MDKIYMEFVKYNKKPYVWAFTGNSMGNQINNIRFFSNPGLFNITSLNHTLECVFGFRIGNDNRSNKFKVCGRRLYNVPGSARNQNQDIDMLDGNAELDIEDEEVDEVNTLEEEYQDPVEILRGARFDMPIGNPIGETIYHVNRTQEPAPVGYFEDLMNRANAVREVDNDEGEGHG